MARRTRPGQALIEFSLMLPVLLFVIIGILDVARAVWQSNTLAFAAREGTRYAIVHGSLSPDPSGPGSARYTAPDQDTGVNAAVAKYTDAAGLSDVTVKSTWPDGTNDRNNRVIVEVTAPFVPTLSDFFTGGLINWTLKGGSQLVIER